MLKRAILCFCIALLQLNSAEARVAHKAVHARGKVFPANHESVRLENQAADAMGARRYMTQSEVDEAVLRGDLVALYNQWTYTISPKLPTNRRYALPATVNFLKELSRGYRAEFGKPLVVDSAIRPASLQRRLIRWNRSAASYKGDKASTHMRGTTIDISRKLTKAEYGWLTFNLFYYKMMGRILVIEESHCFHIFIKEKE